MKIEVVNLRTYKKTGAPNEVLIDRCTPLGNPYPLSNYSRENSIRLYEERARRFIAEAEVTRDLKCMEAQFKIELIKLNRMLKNYGSLVLMCWCKPLACHGDVIKKILYEWNNLAD